MGGPGPSVRKKTLTFFFVFFLVIKLFYRVFNGVFLKITILFQGSRPQRGVKCGSRGGGGGGGRGSGPPWKITSYMGFYRE